MDPTSTQFRETRGTGTEQLRAAGAEVVLMNMQFSRETEAMIHFGPYLIALRQVADATETPLFRRRGIMRYWAESGLFDLRVKEDEEARTARRETLRLHRPHNGRLRDARPPY